MTEPPHQMNDCSRHRPFIHFTTNLVGKSGLAGMRAASTYVVRYREWCRDGISPFLDIFPTSAAAAAAHIFPARTGRRPRGAVEIQASTPLPPTWRDRERCCCSVGSRGLTTGTKEKMVLPPRGRLISFAVYCIVCLFRLSVFLSASNLQGDSSVVQPLSLEVQSS